MLVSENVAQYVQEIRAIRALRVIQTICVTVTVIGFCALIASIKFVFKQVSNVLVLIKNYDTQS